MAAVGAQHKVQQQQNQQLLPCQRSPAPMSTPVAISSATDQTTRSHPNSHPGVDSTQPGSSVPGSALSRSGSVMSLTGLS